MINYIQHEKEFYGVVKLVSGDEVLGPMIATEDKEILLFLCLILPNHMQTLYQMVSIKVLLLDLPNG
ncbi:MAG: hypothetical protein CM15mV6_1930 [uncultured marine virus]|nr:MAG: hypothetical protein CM15mV6_1930 [uncultured marine virus]